jgi:16S rRNA (cytosine1402-N4)-methyltransferase
VDYHTPVLLDEVLRFLSGKERVLDATLGGGGHTAALLQNGARVTAVDRDPAARAEAANRLADHVASGTLRIVDGTFADALEGPLAFEHFDGALFDLGVSSHQFDDESRGFTFREGAELDMRMSSNGPMASDWLNFGTQDELESGFRDYADEPRAKRLAATIIRRRSNRQFSTSDDLVGAIREVLGSRSGPSDFARIFQAVRIAINDEIGQLGRALVAARDRLLPAGVLVVIAYHSVEDRMVKQSFREWSTACTCPPRQPICICGGVALGETLTKKPVGATEEEIARNPRARSARLRAWRKAGA